MLLVSNKWSWGIYEVKINGRTFQIDGQNHYGQSNEWQLFEILSNDSPCWIDTYPTKRMALESLLSEYCS